MTRSDLCTFDGCNVRSRASGKNKPEGTEHHPSRAKDAGLVADKNIAPHFASCPFPAPTTWWFATRIHESFERKHQAGLCADLGLHVGLLRVNGMFDGAATVKRPLVQLLEPASCTHAYPWPPMPLRSVQWFGAHRVAVDVRWFS